MLGDPLDLTGQHLARQPVLRNADTQHAARDRQRLEDGRLVADQRQLSRRAQPGRATAHDRHALVVKDGHGLHRSRVTNLVGDEALEPRDRDRLVQPPACAGALAHVRTDAPANRGEGVGLGGDAVGIVEALLPDQRDVALHRGVNRAGRLAGSPAAMIDGEAGGNGVGEGTRDRLALGDAEVELVREHDRAGLGTLTAADTLLAHVARLVPDGDPELSGRPRDLGHIREGVDADARVGGGVGEPRRQRAHGAVLGREGLGEARHVAADRLLALDQMHLDAGVGQLLGRGEPGDAAADYQRRAVQEGSLLREIGLMMSARDRRRDDPLGLLLGLLGLVLVNVGAALAQVGEGDRVLAQPQLTRDPLEGGALEAARARPDHDVIEPALLDRLFDQPAALGAAHELIHGH